LQQIFFLAFNHPVAYFADVSLTFFWGFVKILYQGKKVYKRYFLLLMTQPYVVFVKGPDPVEPSEVILADGRRNDILR